MHKACAARLRGRWTSPVAACVPGMSMQRPGALGWWLDWSVGCGNARGPAYTARTHAYTPSRCYSASAASRAGGGLGADLAKSLGALDGRERPNFYDSTVQRYGCVSEHAGGGEEMGRERRSEREGTYERGSKEGGRGQGQRVCWRRVLGSEGRGRVGGVAWLRAFHTHTHTHTHTHAHTHTHTHTRTHSTAQHSTAHTETERQQQRQYEYDVQQTVTTVTPVTGWTWFCGRPAVRKSIFFFCRSKRFCSQTQLYSETRKRQRQRQPTRLRIAVSRASSTEQ